MSRARMTTLAFLLLGLSPFILFEIDTLQNILMDIVEL